MLKVRNTQKLKISTNEICEKNWSSTPFAPFTGRHCLADGRPLLARTQAQGLRRPLLLPGVVVVRVPSCEFASSDDYSHFAAARPKDVYKRQVCTFGSKDIIEASRTPFDVVDLLNE